LPEQIGVLALQGAFERHRRALERCGVAVKEVRQPAHLADLDGLVMPGGESTTMSKLLTTFELFDPLAKLINDGLPVFGTCAGMILLANNVLDGRPDQRSFAAIDIDVKRNGYGRQIDSFERNLELASGVTLDEHDQAPSPFLGVFIRAPLVTRVGDEVEPLATVEGDPVLCRRGNVLVCSFHPELTEDDRLHRFFLRNVCD